MKVTLFDRQQELREAWAEAFAGTDVTVTDADFRTIEADAIVSPANSFGFMDGGIDLAYSQHFGWAVQNRLQMIILDMQMPEILVGQAVSVITGNEQIPNLICAPTMRVPARITDSADVYLSTRAAMMIAKMADWHILMPGMGTGVGNVPFAEAAARMRQAYDDVMAKRVPTFASLQEAARHHQGLFPGGK